MQFFHLLSRLAFVGMTRLWLANPCHGHGNPRGEVVSLYCQHASSVRYRLLLQMLHVAWSPCVCFCVCSLSITIICAKMDGPMEMLFGDRLVLEKEPFNV